MNYSDTTSIEISEAREFNRLPEKCGCALVRLTGSALKGKNRTC